MKSLKTKRIGERYARLYGEAERARLEEQARRMRDDVIRQMAAAVVRAIGVVFRDLAGFARSFPEGFAMARMCQNLWCLDDAELAKLGITGRSDIGRYLLETMDRRRGQEAPVPSAADHSTVDRGREEPTVPANDPRPHRHAA